MWRFGYDQHSIPIETLTQQCTYSPISVRCIIQLSIPVPTSANGFSLITSNRLLKHSNGLPDFISAPRLLEFFVRRFCELIFGVFAK